MSDFNNSTFFEKPNPFGECNITQIETFEKKFSIRIPEDYREYLCNFNGAKPINTICSLGENGETTVHHMYGLHNNETYRLKMEKGMLVFADDSFGNKFTINVTNEEDYGFIYFIDSELTGTNFDSESAIKINKSFNEFISFLISEDTYIHNLIKENHEIYERIQNLKKNPQI